MARLWRTLTGRGRATAALGLVLLSAGLGLRYPVVAALGAVLAALVVAELASVLGPATVAASRQVTPRVVVRHGECRARLDLDGARRRALVRVDVADLVDGVPVVATLPDGGPDDGTRPATSVGYAVPTPRRGLVAVGPVRVRMVGLTGMAAQTTTTGAVDHVRVLPRRVPVTSLPAGHRRAVAGGDDSRELGGTDLVGLHEYTLGDDLRRLHWATSARTGTLMVREDAEPSEPHVCVVLDDRASSYPPDERAAEPFEEAVEVAAALCRRTIEAGHPLRFQVASRRVAVSVPGSATRVARPEGQELELLFAEIDTTSEDLHLDLGHADLDLAVVVTGAAADLRELALALSGAPTRIVAAVDPAPAVAVEEHGGLLVMRSADSTSLAAAWDQVAAR